LLFVASYRPPPDLASFLHDALPISQVDCRAAAFGTAVERGIDRLVIEEAAETVDKDRRVPELESVRAAAVRTGEKHQATRWSTKDRKSTRLNSSHVANSYAVFCLKK